MFARSFLVLAGLLLMPVSATAQETPSPDPSPSPAMPVSPVQVIPNDFQLPPGEGEGVQRGPQPSEPVLQALPTPVATGAFRSPVAQPEMAPTDNSDPVPADPAVSEQPLRPVPERPDTGANSPPDNVEVDDREPRDTGLTPFAEETARPAPVARADGEADGEAFSLWFLAIFILPVVALLGMLARHRRNRGREHSEQLTPHQDEGQAEEKLPQPEVPLADLQPRPQYDPATLVSIKPRGLAAELHPARPASNGGLVTTNLAAKQRAQRVATEKARREAEERQSATPPAVTRTIKFDWS